MISPEGFRDLRLSCLLGQRGCAEFLGVGVRTVRDWDYGRSRVPWSVVRLLRIVRLGELPALGWDGWRVLDGGRLVTPAGEVFRASEFVWWALTCLQARSWQHWCASELGAARPVVHVRAFREAVGGVAATAGQSPAEPIGLDTRSGSALKGDVAPVEGASPVGVPLGLSLIETSQKLFEETAQPCGLQGRSGGEDERLPRSRTLSSNLVQPEVYHETAV